MLRPKRDSAASTLRRIRTETKGVAAVEFALILPFILMAYIGSIDVTQAVMASRKVDLVSRTLSDLVSQQPTTGAMTSTTVGTIFNAAQAIMVPFHTTTTTLTVSAVDIKAKSNNTCCDVMVRWSYTQGGTLRACTTALTQVAATVPSQPTNFPVGLIRTDSASQAAYVAGKSTYVIIADVTGSYKPIFGQATSWLTGGMRRTTYTIPRQTGQVTLQTPVNPGSGQSGVVCY